MSFPICWQQLQFQVSTVLYFISIIMSRVAKSQTEKQQNKLSGKKADQLAFKSQPGGPISSWPVLKQSLFFAEVSMISYLSPTECNRAAGKLGFREGKFIERDGSQAYWFQNESDSVVAFRGTEANDWNDIQADVNALTALAETVGKVHRGFKREVDDLWPFLEEALKSNTKTLWFTGHSLGGAMATICAGRCLLSHIKSEPAGLYTFGSPRVGDRRYVNYTNIPHYRWVNNNDIVARVPPFWLGYRHSGKELYLNRHGNLKSDVSGWRRISDRIQGFCSELIQKFRVDHLSDHSIVDYIDHIHGLLRAGEAIEPIDNSKS